MLCGQNPTIHDMYLTVDTFRGIITMCNQRISRCNKSYELHTTNNLLCNFLASFHKVLEKVKEEKENLSSSNMMKKTNNLEEV